MRISKKDLFFCWMASSFISFYAIADVRVDQSLSFGNIAIKDNSQSWSMRLQSNGSITVDNSIIVLEPGKVGKIFFYNLPPSTLVSVSIIDGTGETQFAGSATPNQFTVLPFLDFPTFTTNAFGEYLLTLPGVLQTSGNGSRYIDGSYYRYFELSINY